jgi:hypothetical protein
MFQSVLQCRHLPKNVLLRILLFLRVEGGFNTSTVALGVAEGNKKDLCSWGI